MIQLSKSTGIPLGLNLLACPQRIVARLQNANNMIHEANALEKQRLQTKIDEANRGSQ